MLVGRTFQAPCRGGLPQTVHGLRDASELELSTKREQGPKKTPYTVVLVIGTPQKGPRIFWKLPNGLGLLVLL